MSARNPPAGHGPCPRCAKPVHFRESPSTGDLVYRCDWCRHSARIDKGGPEHKRVLPTLTRDQAPEPEAKPVPAPTPPKPKPARSIFDTGAAS